MGMKVNGTTGLTFPDTTTLGSAGQSSVQAWVNFNGTGTVAIRANFNVSSITDNGVGQYAVNFATALVDANYSAVFTASDSGFVRSATGASSFSTSSVSLESARAGVGDTDQSDCCVAVFR